MSKKMTRNHSVGSIRPVWSARPAAARLRRAAVGPILARPPIRAIQPYIRPQTAAPLMMNLLAWQRRKVYETTMNTGWF